MSKQQALRASSGVRGCILRAPIQPHRTTAPARTSANGSQARGIVGIAAIDTRALTQLIRDKGMPNAVIAHNPGGEFDFEALLARARACPGMEGAELARGVTTAQSYGWSERAWTWDRSFARRSSQSSMLSQ